VSIYAAIARELQPFVRRASAGYIKVMFGVAPQELVIVGLIFLVLFGPSSLPKMAKDIGRFVGEARRAIDDFKEEITAAGEDDEDEDEDKR
jgi:sec-independent protein translocase protein TatB